MLEHTSFHDKEHFSPDCPACNKMASLMGEWAIEYEKEQNNKLSILEKQVRQLKEIDFAEIIGASEFRKAQLDGGQFVYENILRLIRKMEGEK